MFRALCHFLSIILPPSLTTSVGLQQNFDTLQVYLAGAETPVPRRPGETSRDFHPGEAVVVANTTKKSSHEIVGKTGVVQQLLGNGWVLVRMHGSSATTRIQQRYLAHAPTEANVQQHVHSFAMDDARDAANDTPFSDDTYHNGGNHRSRERVNTLQSLRHKLLPSTACIVSRLKSLTPG